MAEIDLKPAVFRINAEGTNEVLENVGTVKLTQVKRIDLATFLHGVQVGFFKMADKDGDFITVRTVQEGTKAFTEGLLFLSEGDY